MTHCEPVADRPDAALHVGDRDRDDRLIDEGHRDG
jgi:hypothetical protein